MFTVDPMSRTPVYVQLTDQVKKYILSGVLKSGDQIPSVRGLSSTLSVNPNTIQKAYTELDSRGLITSVPGKGCFIKPEAIDILRKDKAMELQNLYDLIKELRLAGVSKEAIIECIERSFKDD